MKTRLIHTGIAVGLISLMTFLFIKTNAVKSDTHNRFSQHLHHLIELDATMDRDVLESRYGLLTTYDSLTSEADELRFLEHELKDVPLFLAPDERDRIDRSLNDFSELQEQKQQLIEQFKSRNAILNNSLRYFPLAASDILKQVDGQERKQLEPVDDLLRETLTFYLLNDAELEPSITKKIEALNRFDKKDSSLVGKTDLQILISHARTILKLKPQVDDTVKQIAAIPTSSTVEELIRFYDSSYDRSLEGAESYRLLLYVLSVILLAYIGFIFIKLKKATTELNV
ncbi:MAG: DAHL domain-containing protein, partial [Acidobacteriota bacterium]